MASSKTDILVVGGGLAGCATAYYLARGGRRSAADRARRTQHAGLRRQRRQHPRPDPAYRPFLEEGEAWARNFAPMVEMLIEAIELWRGLEAELGADLEVRIGGGLLIADRPEQMRDIERRMSLERAHGLEIHALTRRSCWTWRPMRRPRRSAAASARSKARPTRSRPPPPSPGARRRPARCFQRHTELHALRGRGRRLPADHQHRHDPGAARRELRRRQRRRGRAPCSGIDVAVQGFPIQVNVTAPVAPLIKHLVYAAGHRLSLKQAAQRHLADRRRLAGAARPRHRPCRSSIPIP